ncbi:MAG: sugar ABC transporter permease [Methanoregulaceae archaeon]|nr:sugar ABC transporter permease [Methanoregulaceae archaeon]
MQRNRPIGYAFVAPATLHLLVFALIPMGYAFYVSLYQWQLFKTERTFVGFGNYALAFGESPFWASLWHSFRFAIMAVPLGMAIALAVAILVNQKLRGVTVFRTLFYVPAIASGVAISMLWIYIYLPETGLINLTLRAFGLQSIDFLNRPEWAMPALAFMSVWTGLGPRMVLFLAGLIGIPSSLYEAAELDGATRWQSFWNITLPMLTPTTLFVLVTSTIGAMQVFTPVYMMTKGGPEGTTDVVGYHIYSEAWLNFNTGLASAKSFILLAVIVLISLLQFRLMRNSTAGSFA